MQAFGIPPAFHHAAGEFVDDDDLAVLLDVVAVAQEQRVGLQRLIDVMDHVDVFDIVEIAGLQQPGLSQPANHPLVASLGQRDRLLLLVEFVIALLEVWNKRIDVAVEFRLVFRGTRNDQRRARLVDQDRVHFVDDSKRMAALYHRGDGVLHVVAQIIEAVFVIRAVGNVGIVGLLTLLVRQSMHDAADSEAEELIDLSHPVRVAAGEIVVHGDDMDALAGERI